MLQPWVGMKSRLGVTLSRAFQKSCGNMAAFSTSQGVAGA
ncbi:hypothetical protein BLL52_1063 [Rhodoferax antarcticus ANT.BR]|uniref:Uncharacterized protein n=1 Tax=Rhodoferax antarcticus ANT.BR TaxID=1111071 RepID=A0A1Q8YIZ7_9BURK|nr:hypothetical protein BLL52_1063 [Rhodoferax antarcticus ANT.BR]